MDNSLTTNTIWLLLCTALVFTMQAGFCCLESGLSRSKNSINVAVKNVVDFCIGGTLFWLFGYAFMFGDSLYGLVGWSDFVFSDVTDTHWPTSVFLFQMVFCATAMTIASGVVAERMRFRAYLFLAIVISGLLLCFEHNLLAVLFDAVMVSRLVIFLGAIEIAATALAQSKKIVEAARRGILAVEIAQMPLADDARPVIRLLQFLRQRDFFQVHPVWCRRDVGFVAEPLLITARY